MSGSGHGFLLRLRLGFSLNCHTIVTIQSKRLKKIEENGKTFFAVRQNFFEKLADHAPIALRNNACRNQNNFLYQMRRRPRHWHRHFNRFLLSLGKSAGPRCPAPLIPPSALMFPTTSTKRWRSRLRMVGRIQRPFGVRSIASPSQQLMLAFDWLSELRW